MKERNKMVRIYGSIPYKNKREKLSAWKELKQQFGDSIKIIIEDGVLTYSCKVKSDTAYF
jgi:hypothetical protein